MPRSPARSSPKVSPLKDTRAGDIRVSGTRIPTLNDDLVLVRLNAANAAPAALDPTERADAMVLKAGKALNKPGIRRESVFGSGSGRGISAYSVYPQDPTLVVRESADGLKTLGRLVGGRFRAVPTKR
ncbi:hypothetical protein [Rhizobacter sp. Root1221]|uniref:hypothetical protein n=1 Tax=Rhizobacter sp. Root1221 TaxID=1736433 RepID=UPI000A9D06D1|nr:hypothetical protein [Rhizobacter sp. Root1221]